MQNLKNGLCYLMAEYLYRFRSVEKLLGSFQELERQEIYFSSPCELNDPLEGFKNIVWQGDAIVWQNLLRHYILCLMQSAYKLVVSGPNFENNSCKNYVFHTPNDLPDAPIRTIYTEICEDFFSDEVAGIFVSTMADNDLHLKRESLVAYLSMLQPFALKALLKTFIAHGHPLTVTPVDMDALTSGCVDHIKTALTAHAAAGAMGDKILTICDSTTIQLNLIQDMNEALPPERAGWMFLLRDYPRFHVDALEDLLFPDWYTACFLDDPTNAAMWGVYGDGHSGACLQFRTKQLASKPSLELYCPVGIGGGRDDTRIFHDFKRHSFEKVVYSNSFPEINFFEYMGTLSQSRLSGFWYLGENGTRSQIAERVLAGDELWRKEYWSNASRVAATKLSHWAHEQEYRLISQSSLVSLDDRASRIYKYRFSDLSGIAFGMKMSHEHKLEIMRIIEKKAIAEQRQDFKFFQARYSSISEKIELQPLNLIKIQI